MHIYSSYIYIYIYIYIYKSKCIDDSEVSNNEENCSKLFKLYNSVYNFSVIKLEQIIRLSPKVQLIASPLDEHQITHNSVAEMLHPAVQVGGLADCC